MKSYPIGLSTYRPSTSLLTYYDLPCVCEIRYSGVSLKPDTSKGIVSDDKGEESLVVDVDEGVLDNVMRLFIRHRVHLPLNIEKLDNLGVYWTPSKSQNGCDGDTEVPVYEDPRVKDLGLRAILPKSDIGDIRRWESAALI